MVRLILLGAPGAGKGTQAAMIKEKFGIVHISTGDILRSNLKDGTPLGLEAKSYMDRGELVPDRLVIKLVEDRLGKDDVKEGFMLDGFPRTVEQAESLNVILKSLAMELDVVLNISVPKEDLVDRIAGRRLCRNCQASYHIEYSPPKKEGICDFCGGELFQRPDDVRETVENRIDVYERQTKPLIDYYGKMGIRKDIDGSIAPKDVFSHTVDVLGVYL